MERKGFTKIEVFRAKCNSGFESLHCIAHLDRDISSLLPYLNTKLGGHEYIEDPPALMIRSFGRLITFHSKSVALNAVKDEKDVEKLLHWVTSELEEVQNDIKTIVPSYRSAPKPNFVRILSFLPRDNCGTCGASTCLEFATWLAQGISSPLDCPPLPKNNMSGLSEYLDGIGVRPDSL